ncbi:Beta-glucosidase-like SFR2, chloroplastic [Glycine max]|nr:Beta-glucosidase-like SFR2, chloroplastic [Glycine max]
MRTLYTTKPRYSKNEKEVVLGAGLKLVENVEYNESGRGVYPDDLYRMLLQFHERYKHLNIPFIITENGEWADGYGPKFGLVAVDRANNLARIPRPSYHLFSKIVNTGKVTHEDRERAWDELQRAAKEKKTRPFYRAVDKHRLMYAGSYLLIISTTNLCLY